MRRIACGVGSPLLRPRSRKPRRWFYGELADRFQGGRRKHVEQVYVTGS
jgi:hypothetical protein